MTDFQAKYPSTHASVGSARRALVAFARCSGLAHEALMDFEIAVGEALANASEHGHEDGACFQVRATNNGGTITVEVQDAGRGFPHWETPRAERPPSGSPRGFGTFIMRTLMDRIEYTNGGSRIVLVKHVPALDTRISQEEA